MSAEIPCPHCGLPVPRPGRSWSPEAQKEAEQAAAEAAEAPATSLLGSGSNDDSFAASPYAPRSNGLEPDPILGAFRSPSSLNEAAPRSADLFPVIDFSSAPAARPPAARKSQGSSDDGEEEVAPTRTWPLILLGSYASALTLALAWSLISNRSGRSVSVEKPGVEVARADPGQLAGLSRIVEPTGPIAADKVVGMGKSLRIGKLEITPIEVKRRDVALQRTDLGGKTQRKDGGKGAFVLTLRLRNTSDDTVFAPLDQAFVRERERQIVDSYIETSDGGRVYPFPLAVESEWSIVGQDFTELRPGESRVVVVASAPEAPRDDRGPFTWRVRLRTGIDQTAVIGVRWPSKS